jgi:hypothetical protein
MANKKVKEEVVEVSEDAAVAAPENQTDVKEKPAKASKTEVVVKYRDHKGEPTERTFSKEVHGEDFAKLADEFKATNAAKIIA